MTAISRTPDAIRVGVAIEYLIGHVTFAEALRRELAGRGDVATWQLDLTWPAAGAIERLPVMRDNWSLRASVRTRAFLERCRPLDAALINTQTASLFSPGFMRRVPTVITTDATPRQFDTVGAAYGHAAGAETAERIKAAVVRRAYRAASLIITWSDWVRGSVIGDYGIEPGKVIVLHPGTRIPAPSGHRVEGGPRRILFVGGDFERKGGNELLRALTDLQGDWQLDIVTRTEVPQAERVRVHRDLAAGDPRLASLYAEADLFVLPTRGEAVPLVVPEAMAAGVPVVSTRVGGIPDLVDDQVGLLVEPGDIRALREAIETVLADDRRREAMGQAARARAARDYDAARNMPRMVDTLLDLARRPAP